jgi:hypothetical protein
MKFFSMDCGLFCSFALWCNILFVFIVCKVFYISYVEHGICLRGNILEDTLRFLYRRLTWLPPPQLSQPVCQPSLPLSLSSLCVAWLCKLAGERRMDHIRRQQFFRINPSAVSTLSRQSLRQLRELLCQLQIILAGESRESWVNTLTIGRIHIHSLMVCSEHRAA